MSVLMERPDMNQQTQGYGPYLLYIQGRTFVTIELPQPPATPPFMFDYEQNIEMSANDPWPSYATPDVPSPFPPIDPMPSFLDPEPDFPVVGQNTSFSAPNSFVPLEGWSSGITPSCTADANPLAYRGSPTGTDFCSSTPSDTPTPESSATYPRLSFITAKPVDEFSGPAPAPMLQTLQLSRDSEAASSPRNDANDLQCPLCNKTESKTRSMHRHLWASHRDYARENNIPSEADTCPVCRRTMRRDNIKRHLNRHRKRSKEGKARR